MEGMFHIAGHFVMTARSPLCAFGRSEPNFAEDLMMGLILKAELLS